MGQDIAGYPMHHRKEKRRKADCRPDIAHQTLGRWNTPWVVFLSVTVIAATAIAAYSNIFRCPLVFDSKFAIGENKTIQQLWPLSVPLCPPNNGETVTGRPLLNLSLAMNYATTGLDTWSYQATNLAIHIFAALSLFGVVRRTLLLPLQRERWGAAATPLGLAVSLLWAVHPLQTESVTYTVQRAESLVGLFYLLTLYCFVRSVDCGRGDDAVPDETKARTAPKPLRWQIASVLACLLGMASKEIMVSAPLVVFLYDRTFATGSFRKAWRQRRGLYTALGCTWLLFAALLATSGNRGGSAGLGTPMSEWAYLCTQFGAIVRYLKLSVWPDPLVMDYGTGLAKHATEIVPYAVVVVLLGLATLAALWRWPKVGFLGVWFFVILGPTSSFIPVATQTVAEHRMYLPLAAVVVLVVLGVFWAGSNRLTQRDVPRQAAAVVGCIALAAIGLRFATVTFGRNADYRSEISIWRDTAKKAPQNARAHYCLGKALETSGQFDKAIGCYRTAVERDPDYWEAHNNLGVLLAQKSEWVEAMTEIQRAVTLRPSEASPRNNLGLVFAAQRQFDKAMAEYGMALKLDPDYADAYNSRGVTLRSLERREEAINDFRTAVRLKPTYWEAHMNLGSILLDRGDAGEAADHYRCALEIYPNHPVSRAMLEKAESQSGRHRPDRPR